MNLKRSQRKPKKNKFIPIPDLVIEDILIRKQLGIKRYGTSLQPFNGRDALRDSYEEVLDLAQYLKQAIIERKYKNARNLTRKTTNRNSKASNKKLKN